MTAEELKKELILDCEKSIKYYEDLFNEALKNDACDSALNTIACLLTKEEQRLKLIEKNFKI